MAQPVASKDPDHSRSDARMESVNALVVFLIVAIGVYAGFRQISPPDCLPANASPQVFSSGRAMRHLEAIAQRPHPVGTLDHSRVRDYIATEITALGTVPEVQKRAAVTSSRGFPLLGANVENVFARLKGSDDGKIVLLVAHYDSVPTGPGANDDGAGVATLLETMRALKEGPPLRNDVAFLYTDAEEVGLLGAKAFVDGYPASKDVKVALNFEARGNGGPSIMFETSHDNGWLIGAFAQAAPYPVANSLSDEVYRRLPNDTDLTVFKEAGIAGLNFAYLKGINYYHTQLDSLAHTDERSLQHHGSYALALARQFGNLDLEHAKNGDAVYFSIPGGFLIRYSRMWVVPGVVLNALLFIAVLVIGFKRKQLSMRGIGLGFGAYLLCGVATVLAVTLVSWVTGRIDRWPSLSGQAEAYNSYYYFMSFAALSVGVTSGLYIWFRKRISVENLTAGALTWCLVLMMSTAIFMPGGSHLFTWSLLFSLIALGLLVTATSYSLKHAVTVSVLAIPGLALLIPMIYVVYLTMTLRVHAVITAMLVVLLGLLVPHFALMSRPNKFALPLAALLASAGLYVAASLTSGFDRDHRLSDSVFYVMNADARKAVWASFDRSRDEWTSQFFSGGFERGPLTDYIASGYSDYMKSGAPLISLEPPDLKIIADRMENGARILRLSIRSARSAPVLMITAEPGSEVLSSTIEGEQIANQKGGRWGLRYYGVPAGGLDITLELKSPEPARLRVTDLSYGLPEIPGFSVNTKPDYIMSSPVPFNDSTLVSRSFSF
ncbi:MAG: M20/M25/M40 family metallo-hydrolase [Blastocatellia bacterium]